MVWDARIHVVCNPWVLPVRNGVLQAVYKDGRVLAGGHRAKLLLVNQAQDVGRANPGEQGETTRQPLEVCRLAW